MAVCKATNKAASCNYIYFVIPIRRTNAFTLTKGVVLSASVQDYDSCYSNFFASRFGEERILK